MWGRASGLLFTVAAVVGAAPAPRDGDTPPRSGAEIWTTACAACHGPDGAGQPQPTVGFDVRLPDLRDCTFATSEPTPDWFAVVHQGGPVRGLDRMMPAFGEALSDEEIARVVDYLRGFCRDLPEWPLGDLNLPRALFTEKAFPENEVVLTSSVALRGPGSVMNELIYEKRLGARAMLEIAFPFGFLETGGSDAGGPTDWKGGVGDLGAAVKHAVVQSARTGTILAFGLDVSIPTGRADRGLGAGHMVLGPFAACGQLFPAGAFVQAHVGADLPVAASDSHPEAF